MKLANKSGPVSIIFVPFSIAIWGNVELVLNADRRLLLMIWTLYPPKPPPSNYCRQLTQGFSLFLPSSRKRNLHKSLETELPNCIWLIHAWLSPFVSFHCIKGGCMTDTTLYTSLVLAGVNSSFISAVLKLKDDLIPAVQVPTSLLKTKQMTD